MRCHAKCHRGREIMWPLLGQTRKLDQFCDYRGLLYPLPIPLTDQGQIGRLQQTHSVRFHAKFYLNRYIVSPLRSENPIFYYIFNFSEDKVERGCTTTNHLLSNGTKTVSIFQCVDDEVVHALYVIQKRDGQKKTKKNRKRKQRTKSLQHRQHDQLHLTSKLVHASMPNSIGIHCRHCGAKKAENPPQTAILTTFTSSWAPVLTPLVIRNLILQTRVSK